MVIHLRRGSDSGQYLLWLVENAPQLHKIFYSLPTNDCPIVVVGRLVATARVVFGGFGSGISSTNRS